MIAYDRDRLMELVRRTALQFGEFRLASGRTASYYLDCRKLTLTAEGALQVAAGMLDKLDKLDGRRPDAVGGMAIGADPITAAIITLDAVRGGGLKGFIVRKEAKGHGTGRDVEGPIAPGERVVVVEDVVTTGGSSIAAIEKLRNFGVTVERVLAIIDRQAGGREAFAAIGVEFESLLDIRDFGLEP